MKRLGLLIGSCVVPFTSAVAVAQEAPGPGNPPFYGYGHMWGRGWGGGWGDGWGWGAGMVLHPFLLILTLVGLVVVVQWIARLIAHGSIHHPGAGGRSRAMEILEERFARGEIGKDEFEEKRKAMGR
jgi:putative membrane protein